MPRYDFLNTETGEVTEHMMSWKDLDQFKADNPHLKQQISVMNIVGGTGDRVKRDAGMNEVLSRIAEKHPNSKLADSHGNKSIKDIKTKQIVKKHIDKQSKTK